MLESDISSSGKFTISLKEGMKIPENKKTEEETKKKKEIVKKNQKGLIERLGEIGTISIREVVEFTRHVSVMLGAGVTIFETIKFLKEESRNKVFKARLTSILENLNNGMSLSAAMRRFPKVFPTIYVNIIHVGEQSGTLPQTMTDLADHLEENERFKSKVKGALIYPKIIGFVMISFILILIIFVMPRILTIFDSLGAEIPTATKVIIAITDFVNNNLIIVFGGIFGLGSLLYFIFQNPAAQKIRDSFYIRAPFFGHIVLNYNTAQIAQHFGTLFASGITIVKALEITKTVVNNKVFQEEVAYMTERVRKGVSLSQSFKEDSKFPPMFIKLLKVGERTGKLPNVVDYMKNYYSSLVDSDVKNITTIIEPLIMVLLGLLVAGLVVTVIGPIYQLISSVGN